MQHINGVNKKNKVLKIELNISTMILLTLKLLTQTI